MNRKLSVSLASLLTVVVGISGCAPTDSKSPQPEIKQVEGIVVEPELNATTGVVKLPMDISGENREESETLNTAHAVAVAICALEMGLEYQVEPELPPSAQKIYAQEQYFGPWTVAQAERWGFVAPASLKDMIANGILPQDTPATDTFLPPAPGKRAIYDLSDDESEVMGKCNEESDNQFIEPVKHDGGWWQEYEPLEFNYTRNKEAVALVDDLGVCFKEHGLVPDSREDEPWYPQGARGDRIDEEQIELALNVVACKDALNFTQRMAEIEAAEQVPVIEKYAAEIIAKRAQIDTAVVAAKKIIAENPDRLLQVNPEHKP